MNFDLTEDQQSIQAAIEKICPEARNLLIVPENGKHGSFYLASLAPEWPIGAPPPDPLWGTLITLVIVSVLAVSGIYLLRTPLLSGRFTIPARMRSHPFVLGALLLVLFLLPVTVMMHDFWKAVDPEAKQTEMISFNKNLALIGGALILFYFVNVTQSVPLGLTGPLFPAW